jgi:hypothetical protein
MPASINRSVKKVLGYPSNASDAEVLTDWRARLKRVCKPCWELKYCPYGPLVEQFPLAPITRAEVEEHNDYLQACLESGKLANGKRLDSSRRKIFAQMVQRSTRHLPTEIHPIVKDVSCRVFGHICPVFIAAEPLTETVDLRRSGRSIPRDVMLKVVRRDGQICQKCHEPVPDDQVEFDHVIPYSRGGTSTAENLRLVHRDCNRQKSDAIDHLLAPDPLVHFVAMHRKRKPKK